MGNLKNIFECARFREHRRNLWADVAVVNRQGITDVVCLMTPPELRKYRVPSLVEELEKNGIFVHQRPIEVSLEL